MAARRVKSRLQRYEDVPHAIGRQFAVMHARGKAVGTSGGDAINFVALLQVNDRTSSPIVAEFVGIMLMYSDERSLTEEAESTCVGGRKMDETEWLVT